MTSSFFIECPTCGRESSNPQDIAERYCGKCHQFHDEMPMAVVGKLRGLLNKFYALCFWAGVGSDAHAFIEFNGLMAKYLDLLAYGAKQGIHPRSVNEHCRVAFPIEEHDMKYLGEKLRCIFGPFLVNNPAMREVLRKALFG